MLEAIKWEKGKLVILDQTLLPTITKYIEIQNVEDGWQVINQMKVRGAPAIAITACLTLAIELKKANHINKTDLFQCVKKLLNYLISARSTAVNVQKASVEIIQLAETLKNDDSKSCSTMTELLIGGIEKMLIKDISDNIAIGNYGAKQFLSQNLKKAIVLTHCNTGSLATAGYGTALGIIRTLHKMNQLDHVYFTETRPYNQGARLTAFELVYENIPSTLICDSMVGAAMNMKNINVVIVGADRVAANGDTANKIGTYQIAILAKHHNIPFYVAAPQTTIDFDTKSGKDIIIEQRAPEEMTHINNIQIAANGINCWNPAFNITPAELITQIITDVGVYKPHELHRLKKV